MEKEKLKFLNRINPFYKAMSILIGTLILSVSYSIKLNFTVFTICILMLLFFSNAKKSTVFKMILPAFLIAFSFFMTGYLFASDASAVQFETGDKLNFMMQTVNMSSLYNGLQLSIRILTFASMGILFVLSTNPDDFVRSLIHQAKLPPKFAYGILAALHLVPTLKDEYSNVVLAYRVRGIKISLFSMKPLFTMLVNSMYWSESIAMAMQSKGFDEDGQRSYYKISKVNKIDIVFSMTFVFSILIAVIMN